jgi:hypothetical protein
MAANTHAGSTSDDTVIFDKPINYLNVFVASGVTFSLSLDKGINYITLPAGFHSFRVGTVAEIRVQSDGAWQMIGVQA